MSRSFNGTTDRLDHTAASPITRYPFTFSGWINSTSITVNQALIQIQDKDAVRPRHHLRLAGAVAGDFAQARTEVDATTTPFAATSTAYSINTWHHVCGVWFNSTDRRVYIDGGSKGTDSTSDVLGFGTGLDSVSLGVSGDSSPDNFLAGMLAHCSIWSIDLTDTEVDALSNGTNPQDIQPDSLVAYWPLAGTASPEPDIIGSFNLTLNGTTQGGSDPTVNASVGASVQEIRPDADITTTGWTTTPLFSKINDESNATTIVGNLV